MYGCHTLQLSPRGRLAADVLISGHFVFADGDHALQKLEMDKLWDNDESLKIIVSLLAEAPGLPEADVIIGVPTGGQRLAEQVVARLHLPFARLERVPGGKKQDFRFITPRDAELAHTARSVRIYEDVVTTLSSVAGVVRLLDPSRQDIHSLAIWRRGRVKPEYKAGVTDHYLVEELISSYPPDHCPAHTQHANR